MNRLHLQAMADLRVSEAWTLLQDEKWSASYYLAGYAIEIALKACISKQFSVDTIPDKGLVNKLYTHDYIVLIGLAGLKDSLINHVRAYPDFSASWAICNDWTPDSRYATWTETDAHTLFAAITDQTYGVLPWIKLHW